MALGLDMKMLYASTAPGSAKNTFTTETNLNDSSGMGVPFRFPADFWLPNNNQVARGFKIVARGIVSSTGTPTFTPVFRLGAAAAAITGPIIGTTTAALTTGSGVSNKGWEAELDVFMKTMAAPGANSTIQGVGRFLSSGFAIIYNELYAASAVASGAAPGNLATIDPTIPNWLCVNALCSASSASNSITLTQLQVYALGPN